MIQKTEGLAEHLTRAAFDKGFSARRAGLPKEQNPFLTGPDKNDILAGCWEQGWDGGVIDRTLE